MDRAPELYQQVFFGTSLPFEARYVALCTWLSMPQRTHGAHVVRETHALGRVLSPLALCMHEGGRMAHTFCMSHVRKCCCFATTYCACMLGGDACMYACMGGWAWAWAWAWASHASWSFTGPAPSRTHELVSTITPASSPANPPTRGSHCHEAHRHCRCSLMHLPSCLSLGQSVGH